MPYTNISWMTDLVLQACCKTDQTSLKLVILCKWKQIKIFSRSCVCTILSEGWFCNCCKCSTVNSYYMGLLSVKGSNLTKCKTQQSLITLQITSHTCQAFIWKVKQQKKHRTKRITTLTLLEYHYEHIFQTHKGTVNFGHCNSYVWTNS